jgi:acetate kinase
VLETLRSLIPLAPLHNPVALAVTEAAREVLPVVPHVAVFDTAFHATLAPEAYLYALPRSWYEEWGYRRFGFHGISCAWATERAAMLLGRSADELGLVIAHLGAGCSVTAVWRGRSVATSMGMTPLEGLVMVTRSGSVDPGVLIAAQREHGLDTDALADALEHRSGLRGLTGSVDVRALVARAVEDPDVALALAVFTRSVASGIASAATALPRMDALVFTGGIGEHAAELRADITRRLATLGVATVSGDPVDEDAVLAPSPVAVLRIEAREDIVIARAARSAAS